MSSLDKAAKDDKARESSPRPDSHSAENPPPPKHDHLDRIGQEFLTGSMLSLADARSHDVTGQRLAPVRLAGPGGGIELAIDFKSIIICTFVWPRIPWPWRRRIDNPAPEAQPDGRQPDGPQPDGPQPDGPRPESGSNPSDR